VRQSAGGRLGTAEEDTSCGRDALSNALRLRPDQGSASAITGTPDLLKISFASISSEGSPLLLSLTLVCPRLV